MRTIAQHILPRHWWQLLVLGFGRNSYLRRSGWILTAKLKHPVDAEGAAIPWMNFSAVDFLSSRLKDHFTLFEFGSGYSTIFFAERVKMVTSLEYDQKWLELVQGMVPDNAELLFCAADSDGDYCRSMQRRSGSYDVVIVDGRDRVNCIRQALASLNPGGVIVLDDSERDRYANAFCLMRDEGFRELTFEGLKPGDASTHRTTIFYKPDNCFDI